jgi:cytochrome oxidase assembly protein ShyY1
VLELLRTRRWLGFTLFAALMVGLCVVLANWQWHRYHLRQAQNAQLDAALSAPAAPVEDLLAAAPAGAAQPLPPQLQWRSVTATGTFDLAAQVAVRQRPQDGTNGFWIVTPLITPNGTLLVNRGWTPANGLDARATPEVPAPPAGPAGTVTVTGRLRPAEPSRDRGETPPGQAWAVDPMTLVTPASQPRYNAYVELTDSQPPATDEQLAPMPVPGHRGTNNLVYTVQWLLFGAVAVVGWWRLLATESQHRRAELAAATEDAGPSQ